MSSPTTNFLTRIVREKGLKSVVYLYGKRGAKNDIVERVECLCELKESGVTWNGKSRSDQTVCLKKRLQLGGGQSSEQL